MDIRIHRVCKRRQKNARPTRACLVVIVNDLRIPFIVKHLRDGLRFRHVVHEPIPVVIVPNEVMIQPRRPGGLEGRAEIAFVPRRDDVKPVRKG